MRQAISAGNFFFVPFDEAQELEDLRFLLRLAPARRVFRRLLSAGNVMGPSMGATERGTEYNEGLRAAGLWLAAKIETSAPGDMARLMQESSNDKMAANAAARRKNSD